MRLLTCRVAVYNILSRIPAPNGRLVRRPDTMKMPTTAKDTKENIKRAIGKTRIEEKEARKDVRCPVDQAKAKNPATPIMDPEMMETKTLLRTRSPTILDPCRRARPRARMRTKSSRSSVADVRSDPTRVVAKITKPVPSVAEVVVDNELKTGDWARTCSSPGASSTPARWSRARRLDCTESASSVFATRTRTRVMSTE